MSLRALIDRAIPAELREGEPLERLRARLCVALPVIGALGAAGAAVVQLAMGRPGAWVALLGSALGLAGTQLLRWTKSLALTGNALVGLAIVFMGYQAVLAGGLASPRLTALVVLPMAAVVLVGWRSAIVWAAILAAGIVTLLALPPELTIAPDMAMPELQRAHGLAALIVLTLSLLITAMYDHSSSVVSRELEEAREEAETATALKSRLVANVSHELRTPLNGILGSLDLVRRQGLDDADREHLETIEHSSLALLRLIEDLLDLSRIEAGGLTLERAPIQLRRSLGRAVRALGPLADERGLELVLHVAPSVPEGLLGDAHRLRQVLLNLLGNALRFTEQGHVTLRVERRGPRLRFEVRDSGIGIAPEDLERLFRAFEQAELSTARERGGSGLGLDIAARLVELMGGGMHVESTLGEGSVFWFELPLIEAEEEAEEEAEAEVEAVTLDPPPRVHVALASARERAAVDAAVEWLGGDVVDEASDAELTLVEDGAAHDGRRVVVVSPGQRKPRPRDEIWLVRPFGAWELAEAIRRARRGAVSTIPPRYAVVGSRGRVLVVDDDATNRSVASQQLERLGFTPVVAEGGEEGLALLAAEPRPLVCALLDLQLGGIDGYETARRIRARERDGEHLALYALTAHADAEARAEAERAGFDGFMSKPLRLAALSERMDRLADREAAPSIDEEAWTELRLLANGSAGFLESLVEGFLASARDRVERLRANGEHTEEIAHALKGASAQVGAKRLSVLALGLERDPEDRARAVAAIDEELARVGAALRARIEALEER